MVVYFFDKNQDLIKIAPDSATIEAYQTQELDEDSLLKDILDVKVFGDEQLLEAEYMAVKSYEGNDQAFDMYRIVTDTTPDKTMSFTGMSLAPYELTGAIIQDMRPVNHSLEYTLTRLLADTDWRLGHIDSDLNNVTTTFYYVSVKEVLKELQSLVGCEFVFKVEISGNKITDKWVEVYREMGNRTKKRFNYGTNALTVVRETNKADIYTALIGRGKGEEVSSADQNDSGQAGYGRKITFDEIEWSITKGDPLNKPKGQYYLELPQATLEYGMRNVDGTLSPRIGIVEFDDEEDPANLLRLTYEQLKVSARPKVLFKSTVANIGATGIGDTVTIHRHDLNMHYETRVRKVVRNKLNDNKTQVELGDAVVTPSTKRAKQNNATIKNLKQELERAQQEITETRISADGKTNNHYGRTEPERKRTGDTWYRPHPSIAGEFQMLTWNGEDWDVIIDTSDTSRVERELEEVIKPQIEEMTASIAEAETKAENALEKVGVNTNLISEHKKTLDDINMYVLPSLSESISGAYGYVDTRVGDIMNSVYSANQSVLNSLTDVRILADSAFEKAQTNEGTLTTVEQTVDDLKGEISQKVTSADVTTALSQFNETVKTQTASQITESLTGYAKSSEAENYAKTYAVEEAGKVEQQLTSYAKSGDLTTLAQNIRTETAESLKSVYTKTETNGLLGGKVSQATYESGIEGVRESVTTLEGDIKDLSSARNLLKDSWHNSEDSPRIINGNYLVKTWDLTEPLKLGKSYTFRVFGLINRTGFNVYTPNGAKSLTGNLGGNNSQYVIKTKDTYMSTAKNRIVWEKTFTLTQEMFDNMTANRVNIYHQQSSETGNAEIYWATLVEGTVGIDWQPAISDMVGQSEFSLFKRDYEATDKLVQETLTTIQSDTGSLSTRINDVKSTADGNKTTISNVQSTLVNKADKSQLNNYATTTSLNQVKQTADGNEALIAKIQETPTSYLADYQKLINRANLVERTLGTTDSAVGENVSRIVQTSGVIQTEVASMPFGGRNLIKNTEDLNGIFGSGYAGSRIKYANYTVPANEWGKDTKATRVTITNAGGTSGVFTTTNHFKMIFGKPYTLSFYVKNLGNNRIQFNLNGLMVNPNGTGSQSIYVNGGESRKVTATGYARTNPEWNWFQILPTPASGVTSMDFVIAYLQVEEGIVASDWGPAVEDTQKQLSTIVTQLDDSWGVKIKSAREAVTSINANVSGVQIKGELLNLDAKTTVAQEFWAKQVNAIKVNADNITTGQLDGSRIRANSIDVNSLSGNRANLISAGLQSSSGGSLELNGDLILSTASDGSQTYIGNGITGARNPEGATIGQIGYVYDGGSPTYTIQTSWGANFAIKQLFYDSYTKSTKNKEALSMYTTDDGYSETTIRMSRINILGDAHLSFHFRHSINGNDNQRLTVNGAESVALRARDSTVFAVSNNGSKNFASLYANLNMQGSQVTNTSDIRLKRDIVNDEIDSLSALMKWQHAGFNYINPDMNQERQFSVIAQSAPDIAFAGEDGYLQVSLNKQVNMTSHALQQHVIKTNDEITQLKAQIASLQEELATLKGD